MTRTSPRCWSIVAASLVASSVPAVAADTLSDSIEDLLRTTQDKVDEVKLWKFQIKPSLRESVIWTDNVFLNDDDEQNVFLRRVTGPGGTITNPEQLARLEETLPEFENAKTRGRVSDFIIQSELTTDVVLPVNKEYDTFFRRDHMTLLGLTVRNQEYLDENELDNNSIFLHTDIFGFLTDLMDVQWGNGFWVRVKDDFSRLRDPLDTEIRLLRQQGLTPVRHFNDFLRTENTANLDLGWRGSSMFDAAAGYENYHLWLDDEDLQQAEHVRHNVHAEVGSKIPGWDKQRAFLRGDYWKYNFARAPVRNDDGSVAFHEQRLNDADVYRAVLGLEGPLYYDRIRTRFESGYESWKPGDEAPRGGDRNQFNHWVGLAEIVYQPWEERPGTQFSFQYRRTVGYSAISNFNAVHEAMFQAKHEVIPKRLDADFSISFTSTVPSDGPRRKLLEAGVGATYHLYKQADLSLRYVFRHQTAQDEIVTNSAFGRGSQLFEYTIQSDSAFYQNIVELALLLHF